jgi:predicted RNase H-like HicB family nuclease
MPARSAKSSSKRKKKAEALDRPFDPAIERRARQTARRYRLILEPDAEVGFIGRGLEMPTVFADGATAETCVEATREALTAAVATMLEVGLRPPAPVAKGTRHAQINIRLTAEEKLILEESARRAGFRGVSDFVRAAALRYGGPQLPARASAGRKERKRIRQARRTGT